MAGNLIAGGNGQDGNVMVFPAAATATNDANKATVHLSGSGAALRVGAGMKSGSVYVMNSLNQVTVVARAADKSSLPGGEIEVRTADQKVTIHLRGSDGALRVGSGGQDGNVYVMNKDDKVAIQLRGSDGDIILQNADCAEDFDLDDLASGEPGTIMVIGEDGKLRPCCEAYDRRVAGVISGAGEHRPAIVLGRTQSAGPRAALAMVGKVCCKVDANHGAIAIGDLLTTSPTPGHAMKASDPARAFGAVIGKALRAHSDGTGLVTILVALQ